MDHIPAKTSRRPRWRSHWRPAVLVTAGALAASASVAACGGGGGSTGPGVAAASRTTAPISHSAGGSAGSVKGTGLLAYSSCMRAHGVPNFPDPAGEGGIPKQGVVSAFQHVSNSQADGAQSACARLLPPGGSLSGRAVQPVTAQDEQDYLKAASCMRWRGITDFPDPTFAAGTVNLHIPSTVDTNSRQFDQARRICQKLIPRGLPYSGSEG